MEYENAEGLSENPYPTQSINTILLKLFNCSNSAKALT